MSNRNERGYLDAYPTKDIPVKRLLLGATCPVCKENFAPDEPLPEGDDASAFIEAYYNHGCAMRVGLFHHKDVR